jgi:hypothetical protein
MSLDILIREPDGIRRAGALVIGRGVPLGTTAGGLPELLEHTPFAEAQLMPSGGDDTAAIQAALASGGRVRLGPGTFNMSGIIQIGTGQSIVGCGPDRTTVQITTNIQPAFIQLSGSGAAIEGLRLLAFNSFQFNCILVESATDVRLRDLRLNAGQHGIRLNNVIRGEVSRVSVDEVLNVGIHATGGEQLVISDTSTRYGTVGLILAQVQGARCTGLMLRDHDVGMIASGSALSFSSVVADTCATGGVTISGGRGVAVSGLDARDCGGAVQVGNSSGIALSGCSALRSGTAVSVANSAAVTVAGLLSDRTGSGSTSPHIVVGGGSTEVMISGIRVVNPATPPTIEVDVSAAGGRVLFAQHNFDPARINSGGNFAQL